MDDKKIDLRPHEILEFMFSGLSREREWILCAAVMRAEMD